jgi:hypothetical protein
MDQPNLNEIERRPLKHWNVDGMPELLMGLIWLLMGGSYVLGPSHGAFRGVAPLVVLAAILWAKWFLKKLKERITYPRVGYVRPLTGMQRQAWSVIAAALLVATIVLVRARSWSGDQRSSMAVGLILAVGFAFLAWRQGTPHMLWYAAATPALYVCYYAARGGVLPLEWMFLLLGAICTVGGAIRLGRFLRGNPKQVETEA